MLTPLSDVYLHDGVVVIVPIRRDVPVLSDEAVDRLDAGRNALLAPVHGTDRRRYLPKEYFVKNSTTSSICSIIIIIIIIRLYIFFKSICSYLYYI